MAKGHNQRDDVLASMTVRRSYLKKLIFPRAVMKARRHLLPKMLLQGSESRQAGAKLTSGNREFSVKFSLGKNQEDRLVLLQSGWKDVVFKLGLEEGDQVTISLDDRASSTYSIEFKKVLAPVERPQAEEAAVYQGGDAHATVTDLCPTLAPSSSSLHGDRKPVNMKFDLNKPPVESDEEEINVDEE